MKGFALAPSAFTNKVWLVRLDRDAWLKSLLVIMLLGSCKSLDAQCGFVQPLRVNQLTAMSTLVVEGEVIAVESSWNNEQQLIYSIIDNHYSS